MHYMNRTQHSTLVIILTLTLMLNAILPALAQEPPTTQPSHTFLPVVTTASAENVTAAGTIGTDSGTRQAMSTNMQDALATNESKGSAMPVILSSPEMGEVIRMWAHRVTAEVAFASYLAQNNPELLSKWAEAFEAKANFDTNAAFNDSVLAFAAGTDEKQAMISYAHYLSVIAVETQGEALSTFVLQVQPDTHTAWIRNTGEKTYSSVTLTEFAREFYPHLLPEAEEIEKKLAAARGGDDCSCWVHYTPDEFKSWFVDTGSENHSWWGFHGKGPAHAGELHSYSANGRRDKEWGYGNWTSVQVNVYCDPRCPEGANCRLKVDADNHYASRSRVEVNRGGGWPFSRGARAESGVISISKYFMPGNVVKEGWDFGPAGMAVKKAHSSSSTWEGFIGLIETTLGVGLTAIGISGSIPSASGGSNGTTTSGPGGTTTGSGSIPPAVGAAAVGGGVTLITDGLKRIGLLFDGGSGSAGSLETIPMLNRSFIEGVEVSNTTAPLKVYMQASASTHTHVFGPRANAWASFASAYGMSVVAYAPQCTEQVKAKPNDANVFWKYWWAEKQLENGAMLNPGLTENEMKDRVILTVDETMNPYYYPGSPFVSATLHSNIQNDHQGVYP